MARTGRAKWKPQTWAAVSFVLLLAAAAWLYSLTSDALFTGRMTNMMSKGRNLYVTLLADDLERPWDARSAWPQTDGSGHRSEIAHATSTEFWQWLVTSGVMNVEFSFFGGPGLSVQPSKDPKDFAPDQNAWCIVANLDRDMPEGLPVLFTRNVAVTNTSQLRGPIRDTLVDVAPLGLDGVVVILNGGSSWAIEGSRLDESWEEYMGEGVRGDYPVLRP